MPAPVMPAGAGAWCYELAQERRAAMECEHIIVESGVATLSSLKRPAEATSPMVDAGSNQASPKRPRPGPGGALRASAPVPSVASALHAPLHASEPAAAAPPPPTPPPAFHTSRQQQAYWQPLQPARDSLSSRHCNTRDKPPLVPSFAARESAKRRAATIDSADADGGSDCGAASKRGRQDAGRGAARPPRCSSGSSESSTCEGLERDWGGFASSGSFASISSGGGGSEALWRVRAPLAERQPDNGARVRVTLMLESDDEEEPEYTVRLNLIFSAARMLACSMQACMVHAGAHGACRGLHAPRSRCMGLHAACKACMQPHASPRMGDSPLHATRAA